MVSHSQVAFANANANHHTATSIVVEVPEHYRRSTARRQSDDAQPINVPREVIGPDVFTGAENRHRSPCRWICQLTAIAQAPVAVAARQREIPRRATDCLSSHMVDRESNKLPALGMAASQAADTHVFRCHANSP
jgi:hypothetical protein